MYTNLSLSKQSWWIAETITKKIIIKILHYSSYRLLEQAKSIAVSCKLDLWWLYVDPLMHISADQSIEKTVYIWSKTVFDYKDDHASLRSTSLVFCRQQLELDQSHQTITWYTLCLLASGLVYHSTYHNADTFGSPYSRPPHHKLFQSVQY